MEGHKIINPYLQISRLIGKDIEFELVQNFVQKYIDDAIKYGGQTYSDASNELKFFFVQLSDAVFQSTVNYEEIMVSKDTKSLFIDLNESTDSDNDELLSVYEISKILKVTTQQVRNLINSNKLKSIKLSARGTRVKKSDFDEFLKSRNL
jgi:excisionase family DNA binding protein